MKLTKCSNGHFYDADKYSFCPQCAESTVPVGAPEYFGGDGATVSLGSNGGAGFYSGGVDDLGGSFTVPVNGNSNYGYDDMSDNDGRTMPLMDTVGQTVPINYVGNNAEEKTMPFYGDFSKEKPVENVNSAASPAVGWLVCVAGKYTGCDYRLFVGKNTIGRKETNSICLSGDLGISREPQVNVVYEPITNRFFAIPGTANALAYVNGDVLLERIDLHKNDVIELGETKLMLIPCCDEKFNWNEILKKKEEK